MNEYELLQLLEECGYEPSDENLEALKEGLANGELAIVEEEVLTEDTELNEMLLSERVSEEKVLEWDEKAEEAKSHKKKADEDLDGEEKKNSNFKKTKTLRKLATAGAAIATTALAIKTGGAVGGAATGIGSALAAGQHIHSIDAQDKANEKSVGDARSAADDAARKQESTERTRKAMHTKWDNQQKAKEKPVEYGTSKEDKSKTGTGKNKKELKAKDDTKKKEDLEEGLKDMIEFHKFKKGIDTKKKEAKEKEKNGGLTNYELKQAAKIQKEEQSRKGMTMKETIIVYVPEYINLSEGLTEYQLMQILDENNCTTNDEDVDLLIESIETGKVLLETRVTDKIAGLDKKAYSDTSELARDNATGETVEKSRSTYTDGERSFTETHEDNLKGEMKAKVHIYSNGNQGKGRGGDGEADNKVGSKMSIDSHHGQPELKVEDEYAKIPEEKKDEARKGLKRKAAKRAMKSYSDSADAEVRETRYNRLVEKHGKEKADKLIAYEETKKAKPKLAVKLVKKDNK